MATLRGTSVSLRSAAMADVETLVAIRETPEVFVLETDPAADNVAAIRCYAKVGFREVGVMRAYERGPDGTFHDGLLMEMLADEFIR